MLDQPLDTRSPAPLRLRTLTPDHAVDFARHVAADLEHLRVHLPWPDAAAEPAGALGWLEAYADGSDGRVLAAGAFDGSEIVGGALLAHHEPAAASIELGCWASSARPGSRRRARGERGPDRVRARRARRGARGVAQHHGQPALARLAERLGFRYEGTLRSAYVLRGERYDLDVLSLVGTELDDMGG